MTSRAVVVRPVRLVLLALMLLASPVIGRPMPTAAGAPEPATAQAALAGLAGAPLLVVENVGQFAPADGTADHGVRFQVRGAQGGAVWLTDDGLWLTVREPAAPAASPASADPMAAITPGPPGRAVALRLRFEGAATPALEPFGRLPTRLSYFRGSDPSQWRADVPVWSGVRYRDLYPDLDLVVDGATGRFDWRWEPTGERGLAALAGAHLRVDGADGLAVTDGWLRLTTALGERTLALPALAGATGAGDAPTGRAVVTPALDGAVVVGPVGAAMTASASEPEAPLTAAGADDLLYSTFIGGSNVDQGLDIAVLDDGVDRDYVFTTGLSFDAIVDFPTTPGAYDTSHNGLYDAVVSMHAPHATGAAQLIYSAFLGGSGNDQGRAIAVGSDRRIYLTGSTNDAVTDFPTTANAYDTSHNGGTDVFVVKVNPNASGPAQLEYATLIGGAGDDAVDELVLGQHGVVYDSPTIAGFTFSAGWPTTADAHNSTHNGGSDAYVAGLDLTATPPGQLRYSTFLGGAANDGAFALERGSNGLIYLAGGTASDNFPTLGISYDATFNGVEDGWVSIIDPSRPPSDQLVDSTYLGGSGRDFIQDLLLNDDFWMALTGVTADAATDFPTTLGAYDTTPNGGDDAFLAILDPQASGSEQLRYGTFFGGSGDDEGRAIASSVAGWYYVTGSTASANFPTTPDAYDTSYNGFEDTFLGVFTAERAKLDQLRYGTFLGGSGNDEGADVFTTPAGRAYLIGSTTDGATDFPTTPGAYDTGHNGGSDIYVAIIDPRDCGDAPAPNRAARGVAGADVPPETIGLPEWYLAEGYTAPGFDEYVTIQNPNNTPATVDITYYLTGLAPVTKSLVAPANSRTTVPVHDPAQGVGRDKFVSAEVQSKNCVGIIVERPMYFTYRGQSGQSVGPRDNQQSPARGVGGQATVTIDGGHNVVGATAPRRSWYFAEGYTAPGFDEYLTLMNPNPTAAPVTLTYFRNGATPVVKTVSVPANSRYTVTVHDPAEGVGRNNGAGWEVSTWVTTSHLGGIVVERPMYTQYVGGIGAVREGHNVMGAPGPRPTWLFPAGETTAADTYLTLLNTTPRDIRTTLTYYVVNQPAPIVKTITVPRQSRFTVAVHDTLNGVGRLGGVAIKVEAADPEGLVVERPIYAAAGASSVVGANAAQLSWLFAEGYTGPGFRTSLVIFNPSVVPAEVKVTYYTPTGAPVVRTLTLTGQSRITIDVNGPTQGIGPNQEVSTKVESTNGIPIVAERPMEFTYNGTLRGIHTAIGFPQ